MVKPLGASKKQRAVTAQILKGKEDLGSDAAVTVREAASKGCGLGQRNTRHWWRNICPLH